MKNVLTSDEKREIRKEQITLLVKSYYEKFDFLKYEPIALLIDKSLNLFLDSDLTIDDINEKLIEAIMDRKKALEERYDDEKVRDNHETLYGKLEQLARLLNKEGIDYQLAGSLCGFLKCDEESNRCHDDIDISLNEQDVGKFQRICESMGLTFEDNRLNSPKVLNNDIPVGDHEIISKDSESDFHIGVFPFERLEDGTVISKEYYHDEDGTACVRENICLPELASEIFGHEEIDFRGTPIVITPPEYVYILKGYTNNKKDKQDMKFLEKQIDKKKLEKIESLSKEKNVVQNVPVNSLPDVDIHNPFNNSDDEIGDMISDYSAGSSNIEKDNGDLEKDRAKVYVKKQESSNTSSSGSNESGFANSSIIVALIGIMFTICAIGATIMYLIG